MIKTNCRRALAIAMLLLLAGGCSISTEQEIEMGREAAPMFEKEFGGLYPDQEVQEYVSGVGQSLVTYAGRRELPWQFRVLNSDQVNAFALPGGFVYITQGLLTRLSSEAELASILGHEIAHVVHRHSVQQIQRAQGAQFIPFLAGLFGGSVAGDIAGLVTQLSLIKYSRDQERQSDLSGMAYIVRGGYDPQGMVSAMRVLQEAGGGAPPEFLSTHPNPGNRIEYLEREIDRKYSGARGSGISGTDSFRRVVR